VRPRRAVAGLALLLVAATAAAVSSAGQEPILTFSVPGEPISIQVGGSAVVVVSIENQSIREADDITVEWSEPEAFATADPPAAIELLPPFERSQIRVPISAPETVAEGEIEGRLVVNYTYCVLDQIEEQCYGFVEELTVTLVVTAPVVPVDGTGPTPEVVEPIVVARPVPWPWIGLGLAALFVGALLATAKFAGAKRLAAFGLTFAVAGGLAYGVIRNQHEQAQGIGAVLCTSCVGIEEAGSRDVKLSDASSAALATLDEDVELTVFYAKWCHSCPAAEAMVERMAKETDRIGYRFVDVVDAPDLAEAYGIVRSGRTVVPAIVRTDSGEILFGVENLEVRLLDLLGVGP